MRDVRNSQAHRIIRYLNNQGHFAINYPASGYARAGIPDILAFLARPGQYAIPVGFEIKRDAKDHPSPIQKITFDTMRAKGIPVFVVWELKQVEAICEDLPGSVGTGHQSQE